MARELGTIERPDWIPSSYTAYSASNDELWQTLEHYTQKYLKISAEQFLMEYNTPNGFASNPAYPSLVQLADLIAEPSGS